VALLGILLSFFYLQPRYWRKESDQPEVDKSYNLLAAFSLVALLSIAVFIFIVIFSRTP